MIRVLAFPARKNKSSNPYNYLLYSGIEKQGVEVKEFTFKRCLMLKYDLIHVHWPELFLNSNYASKALVYSFVFLFCLLFSKIFGKKITWTVHNLKPHNIKYTFLNRIFWPCYLPLVDGAISLSTANQQLFLDKYSFKKKIKNTVIHHGLYTGFYENKVTKSEAREYFSIEQSKKVALFIGQVKTYKNVEVLVKLFNENSLSDSILIIAGRFETEEYFNEVTAAAKNNPNIIIHNKFILDNDLQYYFNAADLCILPFKDIFNSGSALLSVSFNTPVIVPYSENFIEYSNVINNNFITTYKGTVESSIILEHFSNVNMPNSSVINDLSWGVLQEKLAHYYRDVLKS